MAAQVGSHPLRFNVSYPERLSRGLIFVKWLLAFPHYFIRDEYPPFSLR